ncbi:hypothetical protein GW17_00016089 [Ensete ventricosum]|nr:hypothetical protein GW17_00016089 [Ensete ventricosum]
MLLYVVLLSWKLQQVCGLRNVDLVLERNEEQTAVAKRERFLAGVDAVDIDASKKPEAEPSSPFDPFGAEVLRVRGLYCQIEKLQWFCHRVSYLSSQNRNAKDRMLRFRNFFCRSKLAATLTWISVSVLVYLAFRMSLESSDPSPALVTYSDSGNFP